MEKRVSCLETERRALHLGFTAAVLARIVLMAPAVRAHVSADWLARMRAAAPGLFTHAFALVTRATRAVVASCAFKGREHPIE